MRGIRKFVEAIQQPGGFEAVQLRVAENYFAQFGNLAQQGNTMICRDVGSVIVPAVHVIKKPEATALRSA